MSRSGLHHLDSPHRSPLRPCRPIAYRSPDQGSLDGSHYVPAAWFKLVYTYNFVCLVYLQMWKCKGAAKQSSSGLARGGEWRLLFSALSGQCLVTTQRFPLPSEC